MSATSRKKLEKTAIAHATHTYRLSAMHEPFPYTSKIISVPYIYYLFPVKVPHRHLAHRVVAAQADLSVRPYYKLRKRVRARRSQWYPKPRSVMCLTGSICQYLILFSQEYNYFILI